MTVADLLFRAFVPLPAGTRALQLIAGDDLAFVFPVDDQNPHDRLIRSHSPAASLRDQPRDQGLMIAVPARLRAISDRTAAFTHAPRVEYDDPHRAAYRRYGDRRYGDSLLQPSR